MARTATGMFTKKNQRYDRVCVKKPPIKGPVASPTVPMPAHTPIPLLRSSGGNAVLTIEDVSQASGRDRWGRKGQQIGVDGPLQTGGGGVEVPAYGGQGDREPIEVDRHKEGSYGPTHHLRLRSVTRCIFDPSQGSGPLAFLQLSGSLALPC